EAAKPDSIHIATEGPIGLLVRRYCRKRGLPFTTSFHTRFPEYVSARSPIPESLTWRVLRWFHRPSQAVMAATPALAAELRMHGFRNVVLRGALASGLPVAAFPVTGPRDVIGPAPVGVLDEDLRAACLEALQISRQDCVEFAAAHTWQASARVFVEHALNVRPVLSEGEV